MSNSNSSSSGNPGSEESQPQLTISKGKMLIPKGKRPIPKADTSNTVVTPPIDSTAPIVLKKENETSESDPVMEGLTALTEALNITETPIVTAAVTATATATATPTLINIDTYTTKFNEYPSDLVVFAEKNNLTLIPLTSLRGQALALMSQPEVRGQKYLGRDEAVTFFKNIGLETTDAIQQFNKATGLKRIKMRGNYCLQYPFECDTTDIDKRKGVSISGDKNSYINTIKDWWKKNLVDVPNEEWQIGHLDPTIDDASEKNLAYQPPIQGRYRDRFKFDTSFLKMWPTATELLPKMNEFYTDKEQKLIYELLKQKFEKE